jgi:hypothetical protein
MIKFSEWLKEKELNILDTLTEIKKEIKDVHWKNGFGNGTGGILCSKGKI